MNIARPHSLALAIVAAGSTALAAQHDQHKGHHPEGSASAPASKATPSKTTPEMAQMENQMKAMREMHNKVMATKTPEERSALMAEHMKTMREGIDMMKSTRGTGIGGTTNSKGVPADMTQRQRLMETRMEMMQTMMEMMVDRLPQPPAKQ